MKKIFSFLNNCVSFFLGFLITVVVFIAYLPFGLIFPTKVISKHNLTKHKGKALVACNHYSNLDPIFLLVKFFKLPHKRRFLGKIELKKGILGYILTSMGIIFINRGKVDLKAIKTVDKALKADKKVIIFPEGTRNKSESLEMGEVKSGTIFFAKKADSAIIPMRIMERIRPFRRTTVIIGEPYKIGDNGALSTEEEVNVLEKKFEELKNHSVNMEG